MIPFPKKKYSVIYADPPWSYAAGGKKRNVTRHYHTMKPEDIYDLPVQDIADDDCLLFMWATFPNLEIALETIRRWGFKYKTAAFVWVKRNRKSPGWFWGLGNWTRANPEVCLLATKGNPKRASRAVHRVTASGTRSFSIACATTSWGRYCRRRSFMTTTPVRREREHTSAWIV